MDLSLCVLVKCELSGSWQVAVHGRAGKPFYFFLLPNSGIHPETAIQ
jgi:hypothetical protein